MFLENKTTTQTAELPLFFLLTSSLIPFNNLFVRINFTFIFLSVSWMRDAETINNEEQEASSHVQMQRHVHMRDG